MKRNLYLIFITTVVIISSCSNKPKYVYDQPEKPRTSNFETVWVNPEMIYSDSLYSLLRAERIDSIFVEKTVDKDAVNSLAFHIPFASCYSNINLIDSRGDLVYPLFADNLIMGYYKLTYDFLRMDSSLAKSSGLYIKVSYCAKSITHKIEIPSSHTVESVQ